MLLVWRLTPPAFASAIDGEGSRTLGGRWNSPGVAMVYASVHLSLCVLEAYVHMPQAMRLGLPEFAAARLAIPEDAGIREISRLEFDQLMSAPNPMAASRAIGDGWLARGSDLVLRAPSVIVPEESNVMLNPAHPRMGEVSIVSTRAFRFDPRLVRSHAP